MFLKFLKNHRGFIRDIDQFGIPISLRGFNNKKNFKSIVGGACTFLIYSFYLSYLIYVLVLWKTNQIQPSSVRFSQGKNLTTYKFKDETILEICYWKYKESLIDPFAQQDNILMPLFMYYIDGILQPRVSLLKNLKTSKYNSTLIQLNDLDLTMNNNLESSIKRKEGFVIIAECDKQYLEQGQTCASQDHINKFKQQTNYISFFTYVSTFNTYEINTRKVAYEQYISLDYNSTYMMSVQLQQVHSQVNVGLLFQDVKEFNFIESYQPYFQQQSLETSIKLQGRIYYIGYHIRLSPITITQGMRYQNIGEILAQVGSIVSLLMMSRSLIEYFNTYILDNMIQFQILNQWFPQQVKRNKYGKTTGISNASKEQLKQLKSMVESKLDIIEIIYQIQRIQLFLIKKFGRNEVAEANSYVISPHSYLDHQNEIEGENEFYMEDLDIFKYYYQ